MSTEPINLDAVIANMRDHAEGRNGEQHAMLSPDAAGALVAGFDRLQRQEARLNMARDILIRDGYFTADEVGDDLAPRLGEWLSHHRGRMVANTRIEIDDEALWQRIQPRLEQWLANQARILSSAGMGVRM